MGRSFVRMPAEEVAKKCKETIAYIEKEREAKRQKLAQEWADEKNKPTWLHKLFNIECKNFYTKEDFFKYVSPNLFAGGYGTALFYKTTWRDKTLDIAQRLYCAAKQSGDGWVYVDSCDLEHL